MKTYKTQDECRKMFIELLEKTIHEIDLIDRETPMTRSEVEPEWWLSMIFFKRNVIKTLNKQ